MSANAWPFVRAAQLHELLSGPRPPVVLDVRWSLVGPPGAEVHAAGHVPGAVFVDLDVTLASPPGAGGRHPLPDPTVFARHMRRAGVTLDRPVVVTDGADGSVAARAWWLLRHHGHDDVRALDGGFSAWAAGGLDVATRPSGPRITGCPRFSGPGHHHITHRGGRGGRLDCRLPQCAGTRPDILDGAARATALCAHWQVVCRDNLAQRSGGGYRSHSFPRPI